MHHTNCSGVKWGVEKRVERIEGGWENGRERRGWREEEGGERVEAEGGEPPMPSKPAQRPVK